MGGRHLGIDYGGTRIGVAMSDPTNAIATGLCVIRNSEKAVAEIAALVARHGVSVVVVGMPLRFSGGVGTKGEEVRKFIGKLRAGTPAQVVEWDERHTSKEALATLIAMGVRKKARADKGRVDQMAAALILQRFLDRDRP